MPTFHQSYISSTFFLTAQNYLGVPVGTIRATVLLESITAAYEMEEILFELKEHSLGLNCGRWDYLFSYIKKFKCHGDKFAPDRQWLTMDTPLMEAYMTRLIYICHKRGTFAMGGMSAAIPIKNDPKANNEAMERIKKDKLREVTAGHDGSWVAHPALVQLAKDVFDAHMPRPHQIELKPGLAGKSVTEHDLLQLPKIEYGEAITSAGLKKGVAIVIAYTEAWLRGIGCIPLSNVSLLRCWIIMEMILKSITSHILLNKAYGRCSNRRNISRANLAVEISL